MKDIYLRFNINHYPTKSNHYSINHRINFGALEPYYLYSSYVEGKIIFIPFFINFKP